MSSSHLISSQTDPREDGPIPRLGNRRFRLSVLPKTLNWLTTLMVLFLGFLFPIYGFGFGFWFGFVPIMQCQFSLICPVYPSETQTIDLFVQTKAQLPPMEQTIASRLLASFPEASVNCRERPKWVTCTGRLGPGVGVATTSLWVAGFLRWPHTLLGCVSLLDSALPAQCPAESLEPYF